MKRAHRLVTRAVTLAALAAIPTLHACDDATAPRDESFSLTVHVTTPAGAPVEGLRVVGWNLSPSLYPFLQDTLGTPDPLAKRRAATVVRFALPQQVVGSLHAYDLEGRLRQTIFDNMALQAGLHEVVFGRGIEFFAGVEVLQYELTATDPQTGKELFRDKKLMTAVHLDPDRLVTARTDSTGTLTSTDPTWVPGHYELGQLTATDETGQAQGLFELDSTFVLRLIDDQGAFLHIETTLDPGPNRLDLVWDPALVRRPAAPQPSQHQLQYEGDIQLRRVADVLPAGIEFSLRQNYPNPFN